MRPSNLAPRLFQLAVLCAAFALASCGDPAEGSPDSGSSSDRQDAGSRQDAGGGRLDAGAPDSGSGLDAGGEDAATPDDAGEPVDAGEPDSGSGLDAGGEDAATPDDAGEPVDAGEADAGEAPTCGDGVCGATEDCSSCPADCACPASLPLVSFELDWSETMSAPLVAGRRFKVRYALDRLPNCRGTHNGFPAWSMTLLYSFDTEETGEAQLQMTNSQTHGVDPLEPEIDIPAGATEIALWIRNNDINGCQEWDSDFGVNYRFPIFSEPTLQAPIGWAGNFNFLYSTPTSETLKGDVDPAYHFASWSQLGSMVQIEVYLAGVTDRGYSNDEVRAQVARTAVLASSATDAYSGSVPGDPLRRVPLFYAGRSGNNFVYRWFPGFMTTDPGFVDGAYSYRLELSASESSAITTIGVGASNGPRTYVLAKTVRCDLFPSNPPADYCP